MKLHYMDIVQKLSLHFTNKQNLAPWLTDPDWPRIMRVSPLLDWHYSDIWDYLLFYKVPYCKLYDYGYTSLGDASSTNKNPALKCVNVKIGRCVYLPAYKLLNESKERIGRNKTVYD
ncbi:unnamed protein product [Acanthoscelides obtectus]|uniref:FAD synthase n=1 Tax=Acanthoscelides obtectus TaxID=200917 RepID=A0A9P0Q4V9_ACAOB|nr:unnamed protein product [Acanthoscelides obtectus]CAK1638780.1 FAD synthase [Acanthoscelides obtectus]